jgi:N-methylhydantoinase A
MKLDVDAARRAIERHIAVPLGMSVDQAAAGMYRVACNNMAQGVREISIKRGFDPREFPLIVAGGAGPIHSCLISQELEIPLQIVPRESSVLCAMGMLMCDLKHDFVRTFVARLADVDWPRLDALIDAMVAEGDGQLAAERIPRSRRRASLRLDCRYLKQYHEVSFEVPREFVERRDAAAIAALFHAEHNRLYGYSLEGEGASVEIINVRVQAVGATDRPGHAAAPLAGKDASAARKSRRDAYIPEENAFRSVPVYDAQALRHGNCLAGPAIVEAVTTTIFVSAGYDGVCDGQGSIVLYAKGRAELARAVAEEAIA